MMHYIKKVLLIVCFLTAVATASIAGPVRNTVDTYTQPDGSILSVKIKGDEWSRIRTTSDGCAIVRNEDGWWYYGVYDNDGRLTCTEYKAGSKAPAEIISESRRIPYDRLAENAARIRRTVNIRNASQLKKVRNSATRSSADMTRKRGLAILVEFSDVKFTYTKDDIHRLLNQSGYNGTGSAKDYYEDQFGEGWEFTFDVSEIVTLPNRLRYYGQNDSYGYDIRPAAMAWEACKAADANIDFSLYDQDSDGEVDNVYIFYAGRDESEYTDETDLIWAHQYFIVSGEETVSGVTKLDGVTIDRYACSSELAGRKTLTGIGTFCHEYGHTFGLPDFYDTDYDDDGAWAAGLWRSTSLMDGGNYNNDSATPPNFNCIERYLLGLATPKELCNDFSYTLEPIHYNNQCYMMKGRTPGEYFLFECRSNEGWDQYIGGKGMLVYHIDENATEYISEYGMMSKWEYNTVNTDPKHQCADMIEADRRRDDVTRAINPFNNIKGVFFPQSDITSLTPKDYPSYRFWDGSQPEISLAGITLSGNTISFRTGEGSALPVIPEITVMTCTAYPDALYISFRPAELQNYDKAVIEWNRNGSTAIESISIGPAADGTFSYLIDGLQSDNTLYEVRARLEYNEIGGNTLKKQFITKRSPAVIWPYFYLSESNEIRRSEGMIAHVVNASKAVEKAWFLDEEALTVNAQGVIYPEHSGTLSCVLTWEDGSQDTIIKKIEVIEQ